MAVEGGALVLSQQQHGEALRMAGWAGLAAAVAQLQDEGGGIVDSVGSRLLTALMEASRRGHVAIVRVSLEKMRRPSDKGKQWP